MDDALTPLTSAWIEIDPVLKTAADRFAERKYAVIAGPVAGVVSLLAPRHDSGTLQHAEVLGDVLAGRSDSDRPAQ